MKLISIIIAATAITQLTAPAFAADETSTDPSGTWRRQYDWNNTTVQEVVRLNLKSDGKVVGTLSRNDKSHKISDGKLKDNQLSFSVSDDYQAATWITSYNGAVKGDTIEGIVKLSSGGESRDWPWTPTRSVELEDVVGKWQIRIERDAGSVLEPTMQISKDGKEFKSAYTTTQGMVLEVKNLRVEKNNLLFSVRAEFDGGALKVDYKGRPYGDKLAGKLDYDLNGETGQLDFSAKREVAK